MPIFAPNPDRVKQLLAQYAQQGGNPALESFVPVMDTAQPISNLAPRPQTPTQSQPFTPIDNSGIRNFAPQMSDTLNGTVSEPNVDTLNGTVTDNPFTSMAPRPSQITANKINNVFDKDYSITKNPDGTVTRGKDRDKDFDAKDVFGGAGLGAWQGFQRGGIIGAIAGAIGGATDRNTREKYHDEQTLNRLTPRYQTQAAMEGNDQKFDVGQAQINNYKSQEEARRVEALQTAQKQMYDMLGDQQKQVFNIYKELSEYDESLPQYKDLATQAQKVGLPLPKKSYKDDWDFQSLPNGQVKLFNPRTAEVKDLPGNYSKAPTITNADLPDELFGLFSEKDVADQAAASISELPTERRVRPDALTKFPQYKNTDGTFNEAAYWTDAQKPTNSLEETSKPPAADQIYENLPSNLSQKLAQKRGTLRNSQKELSREVARFRTAIGNTRPNENAAPVALTELVDLFNEIMKQAPKQRTASLKKFYANIPNFRIQ